MSDVAETPTESDASFTEERIRERLAEYLRGELGDGVEVGRVRRFPVGFSWLTYGFDAVWREGGRQRHEERILRLGPPTGLFAPYHAYPQFAALQALEGTGVPLPRVYAYRDDLDVFGAPFLVCEKMAGEAPLPWVADGKEAFDPETRQSIAEQFLAALAGIHRFEWRGTPVEPIGPDVGVDEAAAAQIDFWEGMLRRWALQPYPMLEWALGWLREHRPAAPRITIVHGDYRIGNFLLDDGRITAILDWELVHLGDPQEDLGWVCMRAFRGRSPYMCHLIERDRLFARYQELSGIEVSPEAVRFYEIFGIFKLAVIHVGAVRCFEDGRFADLRMPTLGVQLSRLLLQIDTTIGENA